MVDDVVNDGGGGVMNIVARVHGGVAADLLAFSTIW